MLHHARSNTSDSCETEDITSQIDRLNNALELIMQDIEESSYSQTQSRISVTTHDFKSESNFHSDDSELDIINSRYENTIETLAHLLDQKQMIIEDFLSEHLQTKPTRLNTQSNLPDLKQKLISDLSAQNEKKLEKERAKIQEEVQSMNSLKESYYKKHSEVLIVFEKLGLKEQLLAEKEKQLNSKKNAFEKQKEIWEKEKRTEHLSQHKQSSNSRSASNGVTLPAKIDSRGKHLPMEMKVDELSTKQDQIKVYQNELKQLEDRLKTNASSNEQLRTVTIRNKIAALRGEMIINDSFTVPKSPVSKNGASENKTIPVKNLPEGKTLPIQVKTDASGQEISKKAALDFKNNDEIAIRRRDLIRKEKELASREAFLHEMWMRVPGGKELIENVKLTLGKLNSERRSFEKEREDFYVERTEWLKSMEKGINKSRGV